MRLRVGGLALAVVFASAACSGGTPTDGAAGANDTQNTPALYQETPQPGEDALFDQFAVQIQQIQDAMIAGGTIQRGFHVKPHVCALGNVRVFSDDEIREHEQEDGIADRLADIRVGLFAQAATYQAWVRLSNGTIQSKADANPDVRGLAIKLMGVTGDRLMDDGGATQDFLMTNLPFNLAADSPGFMDFARATAGFTLQSDGTMVPAFGGAALTMPAYIATHGFFAFTFTPAIALPIKTMLTQSFWSGGPFRMNEKAAKFLAKPCGDVDYQAQLQAKGLPDLLDPNYLGTDATASLASYDLCYDLYVQFQNDPVAQPIENGEVVWDETVDPPIEVARITIPQLSDPDQLAAEESFCAGLSFTPWHGLRSHQPLGSLNRARQKVYGASATHRNYNGAEPDGTETF
jgi:hypothetical protein